MIMETKNRHDCLFTRCLQKKFNGYPLYSVVTMLLSLMFTIYVLKYAKKNVSDIQFYKGTVNR